MQLVGLLDGIRYISDPLDASVHDATAPKAENLAGNIENAIWRSTIVARTAPIVMRIEIDGLGRG